MNNRRIGALLALALASGVVLFAAAVSSARTDAAASSARTAGVPSWCGPKKITLGLTDGFGGENLRLPTTAPAPDERGQGPRRAPPSHAAGEGQTHKAVPRLQGTGGEGNN